MVKKNKRISRNIILKPEKKEPQTMISPHNEEEKSIFDIDTRIFRKVLEFNGTTQAQFAKEMGISQQKVSDYLQGVDIPVSWTTCLIRICGEEQYKFILSQIRKGKRYQKRLH